MNLSSSLRAMIGQTVVADVEACRRGLADVRSARGVLDGHEVRLLARLDELTTNEPAIFPEAELAAAAKSSLNNATKVRNRKEACERVPELGAALANGATTGDRVDVLANATRGLTPAELGRVAEHGAVIAEIAASGTPRQYRETVERIVGQARDDDGLGRLARQRRASRLRWWTDTHGMWNLAGSFDPVHGIELEGLPIETVRRWACIGTVTPVIVGADGVRLLLGRETRLANRAQRRALRAFYRTCALCETPFEHTQMHHVTWYTLQDGLTDIDNMVPLCRRHHHLVHEGGWKLHLAVDRTLTVTKPDGTTIHAHPDRGPPDGDRVARRLRRSRCTRATWRGIRAPSNRSR
jgi:hypothetical protein